MRCCTSIADTNINVHTRHVIWCRDQTNTSGVHVIWTSSSKTITIGITKSLTLLRNCKKKKEKKKKKETNTILGQSAAGSTYACISMCIFSLHELPTIAFFHIIFESSFFFLFFFPPSTRYSRSIFFFSIVYLHAYKHTRLEKIFWNTRESNRDEGSLAARDDRSISSV